MIFYQTINGKKELWKCEYKDVNSIAGKKILTRTKRFASLEEAEQDGDEIVVGNPFVD